MTHIWGGDLNIIGSDNDLSPGRRQAIIWTNAGILLTGLLGTNLRETVIEIYIFIIFISLFMKCIWKCRLENGSHLSWPQMLKKIAFGYVVW